MRHRASIRIVLAALTLLAGSYLFASESSASDHCRVTPIGIVCEIGGGTPGVDPIPPPPGDDDPLPPLRYLRVSFDAAVGDCWLWARRPPGLDSWDPANDAAIIATRLAYPECPTNPGEPDPAEGAEAVAWAVFRSFPLTAPEVTMQPPGAGITGLPSYLSVVPPSTLDYRETLPGGIDLEVQATVVLVTVDWGDGTVLGYDPVSVVPYPDGEANHTYSLKTCPAAYRVAHPAGPNCHPTLAHYPVEVTFTWWGRYRYGGGWIDLGGLDLATAEAYDVDEVVGLLAP